MGCWAGLSPCWSGVRPAKTAEPGLNWALSDDRLVAWLEGAASRRIHVAKRALTIAARLGPLAAATGATYWRRGAVPDVEERARRLRLALEALGPAFVKL